MINIIVGISLLLTLWLTLFSSANLLCSNMVLRKITTRHVDRWIFIAAFPVFLSVVIYYLLLFNLPANFVFGVMALLVIGTGIFGLPVFSRYIYSSFRHINSRVEYAFIAALSFFILISFFLSLIMPVYSNDLAEYVMLSRYFIDGNTQFIDGERFFENTGFYYIGLHAPGFPLLGAFGDWVFSLHNYGNAVFIKSITGVYAALLLFVSYLYFKKVWNRPIVAVMPIFLFISSYGVIISMVKFHIDTIRIFTILAVVYVILNKNRFSSLYYTILGVVCGLACFIHSLNVFFVFILVFIDFINSDLRGYNKFLKYFISALYIIGLGGIYYLLELTFGSGWVLGEL